MLNHANAAAHLARARTTLGSIRLLRVLSFFALAWLLNESASVCRGSWIIEDVYMGGNAGWNLNIDLGPQGQVHAGFFTSNNDYQYFARQGGSWIHQHTFAGGSELSVDRTGRPSILRRTAPTYELEMATRQDDGGWTYQTVAPGPSQVTTSLVFDRYNRPHVAYIDTQAQELRYATFDGDAWHSSTVAAGPEFRFANSRFAFDLDRHGQAHFAWRDNASALMYAQPTATSWQIAGIGVTHSFIDDLKVDRAGNVHLAYDRSTGSTATSGLHYGFFDGVTWQTQRVSGLDAGGSPRAKLAIDTQGSPHLFTVVSRFQQPEFVAHVSLSDSQWLVDPIAHWPNISSGPEAISVAMTSTGMHVLFATDTQNIHYAFFPIPEPATWVLALSGLLILGWNRRQKSP